MIEIFEHISSMLRSGSRGVLVTVIQVKGSVPRHVGSKMVVHQDGTIFGSIGGGKLEKNVIEEALKLVDHDGCVHKSYQLTEDRGSLCGGKVELLFEPFGEMDRLIIFGAGHIGHALCPIARRAGFRVIVVDNRSDFATPERFPDADEIIAEDYSRAVSRLAFTPRTFITIFTHGHEHDELILEQCLRKPFAYLGMIGSKRKTKTVFHHLEEKGISRELLTQVHSPIGLRIGAETPFEIAISILAEMIAVRQNVPVDPLMMKLNP